MLTSVTKFKLDCFIHGFIHSSFIWLEYFLKTRFCWLNCPNFLFKYLKKFRGLQYIPLSIFLVQLYLFWDLNHLTKKIFYLGKQIKNIIPSNKLVFLLMETPQKEYFLIRDKQWLSFYVPRSKYHYCFH